MKPRHFVVLDLYRFLAAFGIMALHFTEFGRYDQHNGVGAAVLDFSLFVDFFFILSGFVIGLSYFDHVGSVADIATFLRRRIARIYPLHILTFAVYMAPVIVGRTANAAKYDVGELVAQVLLYQSWLPARPLPLNFPAWSISVEWGMYLLFPALVWLARRFGLAALGIVALLGFAAIEFILRSGIVEPPQWFANISIFRALPTFAIGIMLSQIHGWTNIRLGVAAGLCAFCVAVFAMMIHSSPYLVIAIFTLCVFLSASGTDIYLITDSKLAKMLGDASYGVYMIHSITLTIFVQYIWKAGQPPLWYGLLIGIVTTIAAMVLFKIFERPARDIISGRSANLLSRSSLR